MIRRIVVMSHFDLLFILTELTDTSYNYHRQNTIIPLVVVNNVSHDVMISREVCKSTGLVSVAPAG